jgi:amidophosphoribosyltransferase
MATEYRAIAQLPGAEAARIWEPAPQTIYSWGSA